MTGQHVIIKALFLCAIGSVSGQLAVSHVDDEGTMYLDGVWIGSRGNWIFPVKADVYGTPRLIAIAANNTYKSGALIFSLGEYFYSDPSHWRCSDDVQYLLSLEWTEPDFDDTFWKVPKSFGTNGCCAYALYGLYPGPLKNVSMQAHWIWGSVKSAPNYSFCRGNVPANVSYRRVKFGLKNQLPPEFVGGALAQEVENINHVDCALKCLTIGNCLCIRREGEDWECRPSQNTACCSYHYSREARLCRMYHTTFPVEHLDSSDGWKFYEIRPTVSY